MNRLFSILLPAYKRQHLQACIESVLNQTYTFWELIIINDASPENIDGIIQTFNDKRIHYYINQQNIGAYNLVKQWNKCLHYAKGEYCICIGDDDYLLPYCLDTYNDLINHYQQVEILHGQTDIIDTNGQFVSHTAPRPEWESATSLLYHRTFKYKHQFIGDFCYQTKALKARGGFYSLPLAWGSDDISAIQGAEKAGIANTQEVVFYYRSHDNTITTTKYLWAKIYATLLDAKWKRRFLKRKCTTAEDELYRKKLQKNLLKHTITRCYYILHNTFSKNRL